MSSSIKWHYIISGDKTNPPILFLHGFMGSSADWLDIIADLNTSFYCLAVDLPGHGQTNTENYNSYTIENCASSLISLLDTLDLEKINLCGYSMGGRLAYYLAIKYQEHFKKIIVESGSPGLSTLKERNERIAQDKVLCNKLLSVPYDMFLTDWYDLPLFAGMNKKTEDYLRMLKRRSLNDPAKLVLSLEYMGVGTQPSLWDNLSKIQNDILLIAGKKDTKFVNIAQDVIKHLDNGTLIIDEESGHNTHFENKDNYIKTIKYFLDK